MSFLMSWYYIHRHGLGKQNPANLDPLPSLVGRNPNPPLQPLLPRVAREALIFSLSIALTLCAHRAAAPCRRPKLWHCHWPELWYRRTSLSYGAPAAAPSSSARTAASPSFLFDLWRPHHCPRVAACSLSDRAAMTVPSALSCCAHAIGSEMWPTHRRTRATALAATPLELKYVYYFPKLEDECVVQA